MHENGVMNDLARTMESRFYGKYRGVVHNNVDRTGRGRIQVIVPAVMGKEPVWALPCAPYAGADVGFFAIPDKGTGVWVEFEAGNPSYPIWVGCFWADNQISRADADPCIKFLKTKKATIRIDDRLGEIVIENAAGSSITLSPVEIKLEGKLITTQVGAKKTTLSPAAFDVHNGAFTVV